MTNTEKIDLCIKVVATLIAFASAGFALTTYRRNARTKAAEFLLMLHKSFFIDATYLPMRETLDDSSQEGLVALRSLVEQEPAAFTDFLNFFELVAYFHDCETLTMGDGEGLLGYYLGMLEKRRVLRDFLADPEKSFGHLDRYLTLRSSRKVR